MAHRLGIFLAAIVSAFGLLVTRPWMVDPSYVNGGQWKLLIAFLVVALVVYIFIRGVGWVFTGK
jgi:hypothetical protein